MTALNAARRVFTRLGDLLIVTMANGAQGYRGGLAAIQPAGTAVAATATNTLNVVGWFTADAAGGTQVEVSKEIVPFANSTAADLIAKADIGASCYVVDDQTVAKTNGGGARPRAGKVFDVDEYGVWVDFR
ncbi:hypothetical protein [Nevskia sp.]|uniref:hypothetical protein n=1 Tax=Nevskia sp. TaxID=1929292 RepID=UPI0025DBF920|nr:hypothetical protein [Nevskia sp.]